jgi:hypothetical protein
MFFNERNTTRHSRVGENLALKAGVSLVTVLLFMLVATIAATATYKWLTSESRSSANRMQQQEAYQSAVAGIESARSWMTYHANETGALIKQYKDGKNTPIKLTEQLAQFVRAGQSFDVWLVGVDAESAPYKLKVMSTGRARNGRATHSEMAIFNVNGLYKVRMTKKKVKVNTDFHYAYFGGSLNYEGQSEATSMVINGDWEGRPPSTTSGDFVVTGDATLGGNRIDVKAYACIGGDLSTNNGFESQHLYVGGNSTNFTGIIRGNAYFDGDMEMASACGSLNFYVKGNMTVGNGGKLKFTECQDNRQVDGNTCVIENAQIQANGGKVYLNGGAWMESDYPIWRTDNSVDARNIIIGKDNTKKVYIKNGHSYSDYEGLVSKTYHETRIKRNCSQSFTLARAGNNWSNNQYVVPTEPDPLKVCGSLSSTTADERGYSVKPNFYGYEYQACSGVFCSRAYFVDYTRGWTDWTDNNDGVDYSGIFPANTDMEGSYYIYKAPADFLTFDGNRVLPGWRVFNSVADIPVSQTTGATAVPIHISTAVNFDKYFVQRPTVGAYKFKPGEKYFYDVETDSYNYYNYENGSITGSPYCNKGSDDYRPTCNVAPWFTVNGDFQTWSAHKPADLACAEDAKQHCEDIWDSTPGAGCDGSNYTVPDMLQTGYEVFKDYAGKAPCSDVSNHETLATCYKTALAHDKNETNESNKQLYNGYMVLNLTAEHFKNETSAFEGKYIIIIESAEGEMLKLPPTKTANDFVMLYLVNGFSGNHMEGVGSGLHNYFIYTQGDISKITGSFTLDGTIYGKVGSGDDMPCAKLLSNNNVKLIYNDDLMSDMILNGLICSAQSTSCGGPVVITSGSSTSSGITETVTEKPDDYYIGVAPQLSITLESQYENNENVSTANAPSVQGSFIVLPRIVYLTKDAVGELQNYYNVVTLNSTTPASVSSISCPSETGSNTIPVSGKLTDSGNLVEGTYICTVKGSVAGNALEVPFWVKVKGEGADASKVSFTTDFVQLAKGNSVPVSLTWDKTTGAAGATCNVTVSVSDYSSEWGVSASSGVDGSGPDYTVSFNTSDTPPKQVFNVENLDSYDGAVYFTIKETEGCQPGNYSSEVVYNSNSMKVKRRGLDEYCSASGPGYGSADCAAGGVYAKMADSDWPDCNVSVPWVSAEGNHCTQTSMNSEWSCGVTGTVSLTEVGEHPGCNVVIPSENNSAVGPFQTDQEVILYASIKAEQKTFHVGFNVEGSLSSSQAISVDVTGPGTYHATKTCTYGDYNDETRRKANCDIPVYRNSRVSLSPDPVDERVFNYWKCATGSTDCTANAMSTSVPYVITVTGNNTVIAHFGESDKHCFFDEFKDGSNSIRYNRSSIDCYGEDATYCIDDCGSVCANATSASASHPKSKWHLVQGEKANLDYLDGRISQSAASTRGKKESAKALVKTVIMSAVQAGRAGELKAQFQVPRLDGDKGTATVANSGFILRSNVNVSNYLFLNVYAKKEGSVYAKLCLSGTETCYTEKKLTNNTSKISANDMIMMSAKIGPDGSNGDKLVVEIWPNSWSNTSDKVEFLLKNSELSGVESVSGEYVGYSLADPNFKLQGIGWKSDTYGSLCWETIPTISCSFRSAYPGGIVPQSPNEVKPWTGLSAWYGSRSCSVDYYYKGDDACDADEDADPEKCTAGYYEFGESGQHGYQNNGVDVRTAYATVSDCNIYGDEANWATKGVAAHCGKFWVGEMNPCSENYTFTSAANGPEGAYYGHGLASGEANLREATLKVNVENPNLSEIEIYLYSKNRLDGFYNTQFNYSMPYKTTKTGEIEIPIENISSADGFDPENVVGVYVKTFDDDQISVNSVQSSCPNVISVKGCTAEYVASKNKWEVKTVINNYTHTKKISVAQKDGPSISATAPECNYPESNPVCAFEDVTGPRGLQATNTLEWTDYPYQNTGDQAYGFTVTLTTDETPAKVHTATCTANVTGITRTCGETAVIPTVEPGAGLPALTYTISNCPDGKCKYKVTLNTGAVVVDETEIGDCYAQNNCSWDTPTNAANGADSKLAEGDDYYFILESVNDNRAFTVCNSAKFRVKKNMESVPTGACSFEPSTVYTTNRTTTLVVTDKGQGDRWDKRTDTQNISATLSGQGVNQSVTVNRYNDNNNRYEITAPATPGTYTYSITYDGNVFCSASVTVEQVTNVLSATCNDISTYPLKSTAWDITMSGYGSLTKTVALTASVDGTSTNKNCTSSDCSISSETIKAPSAVGDYTYTLSADGSALCGSDTRKYTVLNPLVCKVNGTAITNGQEIDMDEGGSFTFKAEWKDSSIPAYTECSISGSNANKSDCYNDPSKFNSDVTISPSGSGAKEYTYSAKLDRYNGDVAGPFTCNWKMNVKKAKPTFECGNIPTADVGKTGNVNIVLKNVTGCDEGGNYCYYKIEGDGASGTEETGFTNTTGSFSAITNTVKTVTGDTALYVVSLRNSSGTTTNTCSVEFYKKPKPTFECATGLTANVGESDNVTIGLQNVVGCDEGGDYCFYMIQGAGSSGSEESGFTNTTGTFPALTNSEKTNNGDTAHYVVTLKNSSGWSDPQTCVVEFKKSSGGGCPSDVNPYEWECENNYGNGSIPGLGTGARCAKIYAKKATLQAGNADDRTFCVNGVEVDALGETLADDDGYITVCVSSGENASAYVQWHSCFKNPVAIVMDCNGSNSTNLPAGTQMNMSANTCYKKTCNGGKWHITGPQGAKMLYKDCQGNTQTHIFASDWQYWPDIDLGGACTGYFKLNSDGAAAGDCW